MGSHGKLMNSRMGKSVNLTVLQENQSWTHQPLPKDHPKPYQGAIKPPSHKKTPDNRCVELPSIGNARVQRSIQLHLRIALAADSSPTQKFDQLNSGLKKQEPHPKYI